MGGVGEHDWDGYESFVKKKLLLGYYMWQDNCNQVKDDRVIENNPCDKALKLLADNQFYNAKLLLKDCIEDESNPHRQDAMKLWSQIAMLEKDNAVAFIKRLVEAAGAKGQAEQLLTTLPETIDSGAGDLEDFPEVLIPMWRNQLKTAVTSEEMKSLAKSLDGAGK